MRAARGLSQKELAQKLAISPSLVSLMESGDRIPSADVLKRVSDVLEIPPLLIQLLASETKDLSHLGPDGEELLGMQLLRVLTSNFPVGESKEER